MDLSSSMKKSSEIAEAKPTGKCNASEGVKELDFGNEER
jgi:hypothetical protein